MSRPKYHNPDATTKMCACGRAKIYTGRMAEHNPRVDGKQVCEDCFVDKLVNGFYENRRD